MAIYLKSDEEIELLRLSNQLVAKTHAEIARWMKPGITTIKLDNIAEEFIRDHGGVPGFLGYNGFPNTLCISINEAVVHGIPSKRELKDGDIVSVDCGVLMNGYYGDSAFTFPVGQVKEKYLRLLEITKKALYIGIQNAIAGKRLGNVSNAIQKFVEKNGYSVVREMVGHGVGKKLHEEPQVPNYGRKGRGVVLKEGLVIAIEPMVNLGKKHIQQLDDGWTIVTADGKPSAHFEHTIAVRKNKADILSTFDYIYEVLNPKEI